MVNGKLILICQSGGEFVKNDDGTLLYGGGDANAVNVNNETSFQDLKIKLAETCNLELKTMSVKYFLPGNRRNLIMLKGDKDLKRMMDFHVNSITVDVFVSGKEGFDRNALNVSTSSANGVKMHETLKRVTSAPDAADSVQHTPMPSAGGHINSAQSDASPSVLAVDGTSKSSNEATTASCPSSNPDIDDDSDYAPRFISVGDTAVNSLADDEGDGTPADTVKKRRRTASWKVGAQGPKIVAVTDDLKAHKSQKKGNKCQSIVTGEDMEPKGDMSNIENSPLLALCSDELPEKLVSSWRDGITGVGQDFKSVKEFREALQKYSIAQRFVYKLKKNDTNRASGTCASEGCSWRIHASWVPDAESFRIKKFNNVHTCDGEAWKSVHPAKNWLVGIIKERLKESPHHKPKDIADGIFRDFGIKLNYSQVWRGMENAREQLQGSYKESYNQLPWFCEKVVETNPGSIVKLVTNDEKRFQRLFLSFQALVHGFQNGCRPLLFLDAISLKSKYQETLLTATSVDGDDGFFPVAFAIVDVENGDSWCWFLEQLRAAISISHPITFVSDREKNLKNHISGVFGDAYHGYSMFHLLESFKRNLRGPFHGDGRAVLPNIFLAAAHAVRLGGFKKFTEQIRQISSQAYDWTIQIEPECWTSLLFRGQHYNYITQDPAESYKSLMQEVREFTIMQKLEALVYMISDLVGYHQLESKTWSTKLNPSKEKKLQEISVKARGLKVLFSSDIIFEVHDDLNHVVNIEKRDCTCLQWKESGLPCCHAIAIFNCTGKSVYDYCSSYFTVESFRSTYSGTIESIPATGKSVEKEEAGSETVHVLPPDRLAVQEEDEEAKTEDLNKRTVTCSKCKGPGHNKASCKAS